MSKVYVVNHSGHNFTMAEKYGEVVVLTEGKVNIFNTDRLQREMLDRMSGFGENDYVLLTGSPILNVIAGNIALCMSNMVRFLLYNAKDMDYEVRTLSQDNIKAMLKQKGESNE